MENWWTIYNEKASYACNAAQQNEIIEIYEPFQIRTGIILIDN